MSHNTNIATDVFKKYQETLMSAADKISDTFQSFLNQFYVNVSYAEGASSDLFQAAKGVFDFAQTRKSNTPKVRLFNPTSKTHGWDSKYTILEMVNDDMPFLVDSVTEELNKQDIHIQQIIHPIYNVTRDKKGKLKAILPAGDEAGKLESIMQLHLDGVCPQDIDKVAKSIEKVLGLVRYCVDDWKKMLGRLEEATSITKSLINGPKEKKEAFSEAHDFLQWLGKDNFVFLGAIDYEFVKDKGKETIKAIEGSKLGIYRTKEKKFQPTDYQAVLPKYLAFLKEPDPVVITKSHDRCHVHRPVYMDCISVKRYDEKGNIIGERRFLGLFTSTVYYQSANLIPIIRKKITNVLARGKFSQKGHKAKEMVTTLEAFPRDELFQISSDDLYETCLGILPLAVRPKVRLFIHEDRFEHFLSCIIFVPKERFSTELRIKIQDILESAFKGNVADHYTQITDSHVARLHVILKTEPGSIPTVDLTEIENKISEVSRLWTDGLLEQLNLRFGEDKGSTFFQYYKDAFPITYTNSFLTSAAYYDIRIIEKVLSEQSVAFDLYDAYHEDETILHLKIYHSQRKISLSEVMPILENMGLVVIDEHTYFVTPGGETKEVWIHHFRLNAAALGNPKVKEIKQGFEDGILKIWSGEIEDDSLNALILSAGLTWRQVALIRSYSKYLRQIGFTYTQEYIGEVLAKHPQLIKKLMHFFDVRHNPAMSGKRDSNMKSAYSAITQGLSSVENIAEDVVIRRIAECMNATLRTNYYQPGIDGDYKEYVSLKLKSELIPDIPLPCPFVEIFVYSPSVEATHLRGGEVARGGLRWSDRREDFRTEVLGLMKAQMTKNAVIVPVGSKGGFIVKKPPQEGGREAFLNEGVRCYQTFLRGMLDVTDNFVKGKIVHPKDVVCHDGKDPYLVVAADKGTATFSDIANEISKEYNFWLGDAFASGGSEGYDHKKMGITARGAWVSVHRHFMEMNKDTQKEDFTVVGIGDMGGDVFGNGMLLSKHIRLQGAFNHMHIFIDPNPDSARSFKERQRLFNLKRSTWEDYNKDLISEGGGVFSRADKSIKITPQMKECFGIEENSLAPDDLIKALLCAPVELLWNGGIGTYLKASDETHAVVGDKANDNVRVNANDVTCKVIGEGGNLGLTQKARIEYALNGGRLNTDSIDNSAGVDCSDHEVNIKILIDEAIESGKLAPGKRSKLLEDMTDDVAELVLRDNQLQTQALTIAEQQGVALLDSQARLMKMLEEEGLLNPQIEFLPSEDDIARRFIEKKGLTRPELSVLFAYSKVALYNDLVNSSLPDDPYFFQDLGLYFPERLRKPFSKEIADHRLKREIVATFTTNSIVNRVGISFFHYLAENTGANWCDIARAYAATRDAYNLRSLWLEIEGLDGVVPTEVQVEMFLEIQNLVERNTFWLLQKQPQPLDVSKAVEQFSKGVAILSDDIENVLSGTLQDAYQKNFDYYLQFGVPTPLARKIAGLDSMASAYPIIKVAQNGKLPVQFTGNVFFNIGSRLGLGFLRSKVSKLHADSHWQRLSFKVLLDDLHEQQTSITADIIKSRKNKNQTVKATIDAWLAKNDQKIERYDRFIKDLRPLEHVDPSMIVVAIKKLQDICSV